MSTLSNSAPRTSALAGHGLADMFARLKDAIARRRIYTQTRNELEALSTRDLADLGIARSMITRLAWEAAYGK